MKSPTHLILKSDLKGVFKPSNQRLQILIQSMAHKFHIHIYDIAINWNHIHFLIQVRDRNDDVRFIRALTSKLVMGFKAINPNLKTKLFTLRPFTRIISWGADFENVRTYIVKNFFEASGWRKREPTQKKKQRPKKSKPDHIKKIAQSNFSDRRAIKMKDAELAKSCLRIACSQQSKLPPVPRPTPAAILRALSMMLPVYAAEGLEYRSAHWSDLDPTEESMKQTILFTALSLLVATSASAAILTGRFECVRNQKVVKVVQVSKTQVGGIELPVLEFTYPLNDQSYFAGIGYVARNSAGTNYILNANAAITFDDKGVVTAEDECHKVSN